MATYRVTAPMVLLKASGHTGPTFLSFYAGAILPPSVAELDAVNLKRHVDRGWVEEVDEAVVEPAPELAEPPAPAVVDPDAVPTGTADEVLAWVGDDRARAGRALVVEKTAEKPRTTLVDKLAKLADQQQ